MKHNHEEGIIKLSTLDLLKNLLKRKKIVKNKLENTDVPLLDNTANHIAVILDGEVQEVLRAQNRLAALFLSNPEFVEFDPKENYPEIGWKYLDGSFIKPEEPEVEEDI